MLTMDPSQITYIWNRGTWIENGLRNSFQGPYAVVLLPSCQELGKDILLTQ